MRDELTVEADLFEHREVKPHFINPRCFGEDFASWLRDRLAPLTANGFLLKTTGGDSDARRQRIVVSQSQVNLIKWSCIFVQAVCALLAIAMVHSDNGLASAITMGIFATGVAASVLLILSHDRPFTGEISVRPDPLLQVMPETEAGQRERAS